MIPIVISASAFDKNEQACLQHVARIMEQSPLAQSGILLNEAALQYALPADKDIPPITQFTVSAWLDHSNTPRTVLIKREASQLNDYQIILLDARHHEPIVISRLLHIVSQTWFYLRTWQRAFILIADDYHCPPLVSELSAAFYIQPLPISRQTLQAEVHAMNRRINVLRWFGLGRMAKFMHFIVTFLRKTRHHVKKRIAS